MICPDGETHGETYIRIHEGICILKKIYGEEQRRDTIKDTRRDSHKDIRITRKDIRRDIERDI